LTFTNLLLPDSLTSIAIHGTTLYGLVRTSGFNELLTYDLKQDPFATGGYISSTLAPLNFTNLLSPNGITSISVEGTTLYGLISTPGFDELITYDLTQDPFATGGYISSTLAPLNFTNLLPPDSLTLITVHGTTLYGLIRTSGFNELITYDLTQDPFATGGYISSTLAPLTFTNLLPQNGITSIAVDGTTLYGLISTPGFDELITYDLTQDPFATGGYISSTLAPLNFTNLLPADSLIGIAVSSPDAGTGGGGGGGGATSAPEPSTWALMLIGFASIEFASYRAQRRSAAA
jgi:hypothetical protein